MKIKVGDTVMVLAGKDKGKAGVIKAFSKDKTRVLVEGVNKIIKHVKPRQGMEGGRMELFASIHVSNVNIVDPKTKKASRVGYEFDKTGAKKRIAKSSGAELVSIFDKGTKGKTTQKIAA